MTTDAAARSRAVTLPLPAPLLEPRRPALAIAVGWATAFFPSLLLGALLQGVMPDAARPEFNVSGLAAIGALVLFAPIVETLIMGAVLLILLRLVSPTWAVILSAIGWGLAHSSFAPVWGLVIWWPFLVFSTLFVVWRQRSLLAAFAVPAIVHALQNLGPALLIASGQVAGS
ncbi:CPBP family intramembrane glutamic endopeptidase [Sphingomonas sp.]|uniref:CPBP family intramembrane glutamic endopeptidase n=1 Tax=Sphingomonas sp. TaxID=28214 RepID=UPI00286DF89D|nr:CPBP family intramembrane glutamic endopeptidase [Sphingomonas sp.]